MKKLALAIVCISVSAMMANAQKVVSGDVKDLKGAKQMLVEYDYSSMGVGDFPNEKDYTDKKVTEYNEKEKGKGDRWLKAWEGARKSKYQPKFEELFNKRGEKSGISISEKSKKPAYVLIVKTVFTEPGFNIGIMKRPSQVSFEFTFVDATDRSKVIAELSLAKVPGSDFSGMDYDASARIGESYAKAGKMLADYLNKKTK